MRLGCSFICATEMWTGGRCGKSSSAERWPSSAVNAGTWPNSMSWIWWDGSVPRCRWQGCEPRRSAGCAADDRFDRSCGSRSGVRSSPGSPCRHGPAVSAVRTHLGQAEPNIAKLNCVRRRRQISPSAVINPRPCRVRAAGGCRTPLAGTRRGKDRRCSLVDAGHGVVFQCSSL
jgi:hypothetical protein